MRSEWVPVSAAALVTGVMALVLGQMLNPAGPGDSPARQVILAADHEGRWLAMSILYFTGAAAMVLGMPAVMTLFQERRGRGLGMVGVAVFTVGCVGVGGIAALMLMFRSLAITAFAGGTVSSTAAGVTEVTLIRKALEEPGLMVALSVWAYGFMLGVLLMALALLRAKRVPAWIPALLIGFLAVQLVMPFVDSEVFSRVASAAGLLLLAAGFTGMATNAASPRSPVPVTHALVRN
ncbi:MAG TPA: hypothetical protein VFZ64_03635 [Nocardioidaceae bacterium]